MICFMICRFQDYLLIKIISNIEYKYKYMIYQYIIKLCMQFGFQNNFQQIINMLV